MSEKKNPFEKPDRNQNQVKWLIPGEAITVKTTWETHVGYTRYGETKFLTCTTKDGKTIDLIVPRALSFLLYDAFEETGGNPAILTIERTRDNKFVVAVEEP